jgi:hypothetical protein
MEISVYGKVKAAHLGSSQSLCCNCCKGNPRETREQSFRRAVAAQKTALQMLYQVLSGEQK